MNKHKLWHRLRGHRIEVVPFDPSSLDMVRACQVIHRCSCGDQWTFNAIGMYETYTACQ